MAQSSNSLMRLINAVSRYRKRYGFAIAIRVLMHYIYRATKKISIDSNTEPIVEVNGYKLSVNPKDPGISSELLLFKTHEPITTKLISRTLKKGITCLDIGGNLGYYTLLESKIVGNKGKVIVIEPSPENFRYLQKNLKLQDTSNVEAYNFAAGDKNGYTRFLIYEQSNGCMTIPEGEEAQFPGDVIKVPSKKIDSFLEEIQVNKIDFIRMDVEGYEYHIFQGMKNTLEKFKPAIQIEIHKNLMGKQKTKEFFKNLQNYGYEISSYIPRDIDAPLIGRMKDVKNYTINEILHMLEIDMLPSFFMLSLKYQK